MGLLCCLSVLVVVGRPISVPYCKESRPTHGAPLSLGLVAPMPTTGVAACADELLLLQLQAVCPQVDTADLYGCGGQNPFVLYAWASRCSYYVGIASVQRKPKKASPGPTCRWLEHMCDLIRIHTLESNKLRYKLMRRLRPEDTFWLVCRVGPEARIRAMESFEIATRRPGCNVPMCHNPKATKVVSPTRSRPPKHARKPSPFVGPFDCAASRLSMDKLAYKMGRPKASLVVHDEASNFSLAYLAWVRKLFVLHGTFGPYDIYDPRLAGLLVRWCGSKGSERVGCGPAAIWKSVSLLKGRRARAMATRNGSRELVARNLPKTFGVTFKVPREACLRVVKRALIHAVRFDPQWNHDEKTWLLSRLRLAGPSEKHSHLVVCVTPLRSANVLAGAGTRGHARPPGSCLSSFDKASNPATSIVLKRFGMFLCVLLFRMTGLQFPLVSVDVVLVCSCLRVDSWRACEAVSMADESLQTDPCYMREQRVFKQTLSAYASYTADMSRRPGEGSDCLLPMAFVEICMPGPCLGIDNLDP